MLLLGMLLSGTAQAQAPRVSATPLEQALVQQDSSGVTVLGQNGHEGNYRGQTIASGVQLACNGPLGSVRAEFHLGGQYDQLDLTLSNEDPNTTVAILINDKSDPAHPRQLYTTNLVALGQVRPRIRVSGVQFLTIEQPTTCSTVDVQGTLTKGTPLTKRPTPMTQVVARYPTGNAGVPAGSKVLFGWQPFPRATNYAIHLWLVGLSGSAVLTRTMPFSFSGSVYHKTSYTWNDAGFPPGTYQYSLLPLDDRGHNLAGWSTPVQFTIVAG
jgi:hypothetical protein